MKAVFNTEKVTYELSKSGYTRNGHFVQGEVTLKELSIGQPACIEVNSNGYKQVIRTDIVTDIEVCPAFFKMKMNTEVHPYKITIRRSEGHVLSTMKIGTEKEVKAAISKMYPDCKVNYEISPIPTRKRGIS
ncbi:hypothetical protein WMO40_13340 [Bacillaceae bacterium CLA-AA-H227]|uniref:Uncharacterized protein n=2 Tax=Robertmurraya TaxID=2837507 RepID=A0A4U1CY64_9BACI|nr:hypothetical protein [Robertmurraya kyonggiensis]TKC14995.1 hypothetical protein FA727_19040 [Robertmurraya kyonggiensis]